jgi:hypothetical protein
MKEVNLKDAHVTFHNTITWIKKFENGKAKLNGKRLAMKLTCSIGN